MIEPAQIRGKPVQGVVFFNIGPGALRHCRSEFGVLHEPNQCRDKAFEIIRLE